MRMCLPLIMAIASLGWCAHALAAENPENRTGDTTEDTPGNASENTDQASEPKAPTDTPTVTEESDRVEPGDVRKTVSQSLELFVPSEEIDVDKPVDFPTNI